MEQCKHPRVQIVSRDEEAEFVECMECGEIFTFRTSTDRPTGFCPSK